jgi:hypothetical protein
VKKIKKSHVHYGMTRREDVADELQSETKARHTSNGDQKTEPRGTATNMHNEIIKQARYQRSMEISNGGNGEPLGMSKKMHK